MQQAILDTHGGEFYTKAGKVAHLSPQLILPKVEVIKIEGAVCTIRLPEETRRVYGDIEVEDGPRGGWVPVPEIEVRKPLIHELPGQV